MHTAAAADLLRRYDTALPEVYGYLLRRTGRVEVAEELTAETFLAAAAEVRRPRPDAVDVPWLIGVARHKLADHWRRQARVRRSLCWLPPTDPHSRCSPTGPATPRSGACWRSWATGARCWCPW